MKTTKLNAAYTAAIEKYLTTPIGSPESYALRKEALTASEELLKAEKAAEKLEDLRSHAERLMFAAEALMHSLEDAESVDDIDYTAADEIDGATADLVEALSDVGPPLSRAMGPGF